MWMKSLTQQNKKFLKRKVENKPKTKGWKITQKELKMELEEFAIKKIKNKKKFLTQSNKNWIKEILYWFQFLKKTWSL